MGAALLGLPAFANSKPKPRNLYFYLQSPQSWSLSENGACPRVAIVAMARLFESGLSVIDLPILGQTPRQRSDE